MCYHKSISIYSAISIYVIRLELFCHTELDSMRVWCLFLHVHIIFKKSVLHLILWALQGALADMFLRGTELMKDARGIASLVRIQLTWAYPCIIMHREMLINSVLVSLSVVRLVCCLYLCHLLKHLLRLSRPLSRAHCIMLQLRQKVCYLSPILSS